MNLLSDYILMDQEEVLLIQYFLLCIALIEVNFAPLNSLPLKNIDYVQRIETNQT